MKLFIINNINKISNKVILIFSLTNVNKIKILNFLQLKVLNYLQTKFLKIINKNNNFNNNKKLFKLIKINNQVHKKKNLILNLII